ncbi:MAG: alpha/beta hydrolase [Proteobacteria bacterium]|nr:alpha/beta hydrolase [Pseudomonadota bacterium]MBI3498699.1 alpha/beta hydrolase [Pseudomonadota bacterium]
MRDLLRLAASPQHWLRSGRLLLALPSLVVGGCTQAELVNALVPRDDFRLTTDLSYGPGARQVLDVYRPATGEGKRAVVVFFYGGNWDSGAKGDYLFVGEALASRGFITIIPDYRIYPEVRYPAFLEDAAAAFRWTLDHLAELGGDPARIHLMGHSAGAYIAAMLTLDERWLGAGRGRIRSTVGLAGPYDFLPLTDPKLQIIFAPEADLERTQPISFVDGTAAPVFLASGLADTTVRPGNAERLGARIRAQGGVADERYYAALGHIGLVAALASPLRFLDPVLDDVVAFLGRE